MDNLNTVMTTILVGTTSSLAVYWFLCRPLAHWLILLKNRDDVAIANQVGYNIVPEKYSARYFSAIWLSFFVGLVMSILVSVLAYQYQLMMPGDLWLAFLAKEMRMVTQVLLAYSLIIYAYGALLYSVWHLYRARGMVDWVPRPVPPSYESKKKQSQLRLVK